MQKPFTVWANVLIARKSLFAPCQKHGFASESCAKFTQISKGPNLESGMDIKNVQNLDILHDYLKRFTVENHLYLISY